MSEEALFPILPGDYWQSSYGGTTMCIATLPMTIVLMLCDKKTFAIREFETQQIVQRLHESNVRRYRP